MPVLGAASSVPATRMPIPPFLLGGAIVRWGGSSIASWSYGYLSQLYGFTGTLGATPQGAVGGGLYGGMLVQVNFFGGPGQDTNDALGRNKYADVAATSRYVTHLDSITNDIQAAQGNSDLTKGRNAFSELWRGVLARLRADAQFDTDASQWVFSGTWTAETTTMADGSHISTGKGWWLNWKRRSTTVQNDTATFTVPAGVTTGYVLLSGVNNSGAGYTGAAYSISGAGLSSPITGTTSDKANQSSYFAAQTATMAIKVTGLTPGGSLVVTKTDAGGTRLGVEGFITPNPTPNTVVITKPYPTSGQVSLLSTYNALLDAVIAEFVTAPYSLTNAAGDQSILVFDPVVAGFDAATMAADTLHPNDYGHRRMREWFEAFFMGVTMRNGAQH